MRPSVIETKPRVAVVAATADDDNNVDIFPHLIFFRMTSLDWWFGKERERERENLVK